LEDLRCQPFEKGLIGVLGGVFLHSLEYIHRSLEHMVLHIVVHESVLYELLLPVGTRACNYRSLGFNKAGTHVSDERQARVF
jgi:hypothetical protein